MLPCFSCRLGHRRRPSNSSARLARGCHNSSSYVRVRVVFASGFSTGEWPDDHRSIDAHPDFCLHWPSGHTMCKYSTADRKPAPKFSSIFISDERAGGLSSKTKPRGCRTSIIDGVFILRQSPPHKITFLSSQGQLYQPLTFSVSPYDSRGPRIRSK